MAKKDGTTITFILCLGELMPISWLVGTGTFYHIRNENAKLWPQFLLSVLWLEMGMS